MEARAMGQPRRVPQAGGAVAKLECGAGKDPPGTERQGERIGANAVCVGIKGCCEILAITGILDRDDD